MVARYILLVCFNHAPAVLRKTGGAIATPSLLGNINVNGAIAVTVGLVITATKLYAGLDVQMADAHLLANVTAILVGQVLYATLLFARLGASAEAVSKSQVHATAQVVGRGISATERYAARGVSMALVLFQMRVTVKTGGQATSVM